MTPLMHKSVTLESCGRPQHRVQSLGRVWWNRRRHPGRLTHGIALGQAPAQQFSVEIAGLNGLGAPETGEERV